MIEGGFKLHAARERQLKPVLRCAAWSGEVSAQSHDYGYECKLLHCRLGGDLSLKLVDDLKRIYDTYLESVVPPGDMPLK